MLKKIDPKSITQNPFTLIGDQWMLITAGTPEHCNTMTASWGGVGVMWGAPAATAYIRPQRYTKTFMDANDYYTLSFFSEDYRKQLALCGRVSGRDVDKFKECGFTVATAEYGAPYIEQAELVLVCRKQYAQDMKPECFIDTNAREKWYPASDYHCMYIGQIIEVLVK